MNSSSRSKQKLNVIYLCLRFVTALNPIGFNEITYADKWPKESLNKVEKSGRRRVATHSSQIIQSNVNILSRFAHFFFCLLCIRIESYKTCLN